MNFQLPSGSAMERALACPGSTALPRVERTSGAPAERGIAVHAFIAAVPTLGREMALEAVPKRWRPFCESLPLDKLNMGSFRPEVSFAYRPGADTARILGQNIGRSYLNYGWNPATEVPVTPDGVGLTSDAVYIVDWKSGWGDVTTPRENWQLKVGALAACRHFHRNRALVEIVHLREGSKKPWVEPYEFDSIVLDDTAEQIAAAMPGWMEAFEQVQRGERPRIVAGEHCGYCGCVADCPATSGLITRFGEAILLGQAPYEGETNELRKWLVPHLTPEKAKATREILVQLKAVTAQVEGALKDYSTTLPFETKDGKVYGPRSIDKEELDPSVVWAVVKQHGGEEIAKLAVSMDATKTSLKDAARELTALKGGRTSRWEEQLLQEIRDRGGSKITPGTRFEEHRPQEVET